MQVVCCITQRELRRLHIALGCLPPIRSGVKFVRNDTLHGVVASCEQTAKSAFANGNPVLSYGEGSAAGRQGLQENPICQNRKQTSFFPIRNKQFKHDSNHFQLDCSNDSCFQPFSGPPARSLKYDFPESSKILLTENENRVPPVFVE